MDTIWARTGKRPLCIYKYERSTNDSVSTTIAFIVVDNIPWWYHSAPQNGCQEWYSDSTISSDSGGGLYYSGKRDIVEQWKEELFPDSSGAI